MGKRLFVDIDGTLAVFNHVDTLETLYEPGYYENLEPIYSVVDSVKSIIENNPDIEVNILSAYLSDSRYALDEKNAWLNRFLPEISAENRIFMPCGEDKKKYIPGGVTKRDFLLDDYTHNLKLWDTHGTGIKLLNGINHTNETWTGSRIRFDSSVSDLTSAIVNIVNGEKVYDIKPQQEGMKMAKSININKGDVIYSQIQLDGSEEKAKRLLYVADINENQELICLNITSANPKKDHDQFKADQPINSTKENGLKKDSYVKTNVEYILSKDNYKFKMEKITLSQQDKDNIDKRYNKLNSQGKVKRADNRYQKDNEFDKLNQKIKQLTQDFKQDPELVKDYIKFSSRFYQFSPRNTALIYTQNRRATFVASFNDWKNKLGYNIKKNSKAMYILRPIEKEYFQRGNERVPIAQATQDEKIKIAKKEIKIDTETYFKRYPVFDISQTNCPKKDYPKVYDTGYESLEHGLRYESVKEFAQEAGFSVTEKTIDSISLYGYYDRSDNSIVISDKLDDSKKLSTLCHEVSHGLMHQTTTQPTHVKEFEAETLSLMMCTRMGVDADPQSIGYISSHFSKINQEKHPFDKSMDRVKKAFDYSDGKIKRIIESNPTYQQEMEHNKEQSYRPDKAITQNRNEKQGNAQNFTRE